MKTILIVLTIAFSTSSFAQEFNLYKVINKLEKFESKSGVGSHVKKGKTVSSNKSCYLHVENIDVWNSDYAVTADYLILNMNGKEVTTDLQGWNSKKVISSKKADGSISYTNKFTSTTNCKVSETLLISKNAVKYSESVECQDGRKSYTQSANCKF